MSKKRILALLMSAVLAAGGIGQTAMAAAADFSDGEMISEESFFEGTLSEEEALLEDGEPDEIMIFDGEEEAEDFILTDGEQPEVQEEESQPEEGAEETASHVFFHDIPNDGVSQLVGWNIEIGKDTSCYVEGPDGGYDTGAVISSVNVEDVLEEGEEQQENPVVSINPYDDGNGWNLHMNRFGHARVSLAYTYFVQTDQGEQEKSGQHSFDIWVGGTVYNMDLSSETGINKLLPGASLDLKANVWMDCYDEERGHYPGDTSNIRVKWSVENAENAKISIEEAENDNRRLHVTAGETTERTVEHVFAEAEVSREDGGTEIVASSDIWIVTEEGYYQILIDKIGELECLEPGDTASVSPVLKSYSLGNNPYEVTEGIRYRVERWDPNALAITCADGTAPGENGICSSVPLTIKKLQNWRCELELVAESFDEETGYAEELVRYFIQFQERDYGVWFDNLRGGDHTWVFSDEDMKLHLNTERIPGFSDNEKYSVDWKMGIRDNDGKFEVSFGPDTQEKKGAYQINGTEIILHGDVIKDKLDSLGLESWFEIAAVVKVNGVDVNEAGTGAEVRNSDYDYHYPCSGPGENQMLPGESIFISNRMGAYVENSEHPHGEEVEVEITGLKVVRYGDWNEEGEEITSEQEKIRIEEQEDGWSLYGDDFGFAELVVTYTSLFTGEEETYLFTVYAVGDIYELGWEYQNGTDCMLVEDEKEIYLNVSYKYNRDGENHYEGVDDCILEIRTDDDGNPFYDTNLIQAELKKDENGRYVLRIASGQEYGGTDICVRVLIPNEKGEYEERCDNWIHINVNDAFENFEPVILADDDGSAVNPGIGTELDLSKFEYEVVRYAQGREPEVLEGIRFRLRDWDPNAWEIQEGSDELLPVLKRMAPWGTGIVIIAEEYNAEQESWQYINERRYWFDGLEYNMHVETDTETAMMFPDSSLNLVTKAWRTIHDTDNGRERWEVAPAGVYKLIYSDYDEDLIAIDENGLVTSKENTGSTPVKVTAFITLADGRDEYLCEIWIDLHVEERYLKVEAEPVCAEPGETVSITDIGAMLKEYSVENRDGKTINEAEITFLEVNDLLQLSEDRKSFTVKKGILTEKEFPVTIRFSLRAVVDGMVDEEGNLISTYGGKKLILCSHRWDEGVVTTKATCTTKGEKVYTCERCEKTRAEEIPALGHKEVTDAAVKATTAKSGLTQGKHCSVCGEVFVKQEVIPAVSSITLTKTSYTYNGKVQKPSVTVKDSHGKAISTTQYTVSYSNASSKNAGKYTVTVRLKGNYSGSKILPYTIGKASQKITASSKTVTLGARAFSLGAKASGGGKLSYKTDNKAVALVSSKGVITIKGVGKATITINASANTNYNAAPAKKVTVTVLPKKTAVSKVSSSSKGKADVSWKKVSGVTGYSIQYSTSSKFSGAKTVTVKGSSASGTTLKSLKSKKNYYVRVCTYKKVNGKTYYSDWSSAKKVKIK